MNRSNLYFLLLTASALSIASCQKTELCDTTAEREFTLTAGIPSSISTYANGPQAFSHNGGANNVDPDMYDLRYTLEVYDGDNMVYEEVKTVTEAFISESVEFNVRLLAKKYDFVIWADFVYNSASSGDAADLYYDTHDLRAVKFTPEVMDGSLSLSDDAADAYFRKIEVDLSASGQKVTDIKLQRPLGKVRFIATDSNLLPTLTERPAKVELDFGDANVPTTFNAVTGQAGNEEMAVGTLIFDAVQENASVGGNIKNGAYLLGYAYFFATLPSSAYETEITVISDLGEQIGYRQLSKIPVQANKLTTVIGNFYTNEGGVNVIIEDAFTNGEEEVTIPETINAQSLKDAEDILADMASKGATHDIVIIFEDKISSSDNSRKIEMPNLPSNITLSFKGGMPDEGLTIEDVNNDFAGNLTVMNAGTSQQLDISLPYGNCTLQSGAYTAVSTNAGSTEINSEVSVAQLNAYNGNIKLYGSVETISRQTGYNDKIYRCLNDNRSLDNLLGDNAGFDELIIEKEANINGNGQEIKYPIEIMADAYVSNLVFKPQNEETYVVTISGTDAEVTLDGCEIYQLKKGSGSESCSAILVGGNAQNVTVRNSQVIMHPEFYMQRGVNISEAADATVTLDNTHIGVSKEPMPDVYTEEEIITFKKGYDSRAVSFFNNTGLTTLNIINGSVLERAFYAVNWAGTSDKIIVNAEDAHIDGRAAFNINSGTNEINVRNSRLVGRNYFTGPTENFAVIVYGYNCSGTKVTVSEGSEIISHNSPQTATNFEFSASLRSPACELTIENSTLTELAAGSVPPRMNYFIEDDCYGENTINIRNVTVQGKEGALALPLMVWDGVRKTEPRLSKFIIGDDADKYEYYCYIIIEPSDLAWFADMVNEGNETVKDKGVFFSRDIDLNGHNWTPIGYSGGNNSFKGMALGNDKTVRNLVVEGLEPDKSAGLFGTVNGQICDLTIENATIKHIVDGSNGGVAAVAGSIYPNGTVENVNVRNASIESNRWTGTIVGYLYGSVYNCTVADAAITLIPDRLTGNFDNGDKCGGIAGYSAGDNHGEITANTVSGLNIKGYRDIGGIAGAANATALKGNSIENVTITVDQTTGHYGQKDANAGYILGRNLSSGSLPEDNTESGSNSIEIK